ncbi:hypothetical protein H2203_009025 [Taxawa tesnikishii (nom. ined.)]|nr:hypothetical protein H2203_009025 [Dothideales sp. JES 119]
MLFKQLITITALAATALAAPRNATDYGELMRRWAKDDDANWHACDAKDHVINRAIQDFCETNNPDDNLHVPSYYSIAGQVKTNVETGQVRIKILGPKCIIKSSWNEPHDQQGPWVPREFCSSQFWHVCAHGDKTGRGKGYYGGDGCQQFIIEDA